MDTISILSYIALFSVYFYTMIKSRTFMFFCLILFFGVYYIFPPLIYFTLIPENDYLTISGEVIFLEKYLTTENILTINLLSILFILLLKIIVPNKIPEQVPIKIKDLAYKNKKKIKKITILILILTLLINFYLIYQSGGLYNFYYGGTWHSRYEGGLGQTIIMNLKSLLPCFGIALCALLSSNRRNTLIAIIFLILFLISFMYGGSNRKFALLGVFIYFSIQIDLLANKKAKKYFISGIFLLFFLFQFLLILRSSNFSLDAILSALNKISDVIIISEPIGTYSLILKLTNSILTNDLPLGYFYDAFKYLLLPLSPWLDYSQPNIAKTLGLYINGQDNFTFFPTIIFEGIYNGHIIGAVIFYFIYAIITRKVTLRLYLSNNLSSYIYWVIIYNVCIIQLIRGYLSNTIAYFLVVSVIYPFLYLCLSSKYKVYDKKIH
ncbi:TPA: O-antigen polymerase [Providencia alcalifaciens]